MNKLDKMASSDAHKWARAEMFFGEGAGTRRKLLGAEIEQKVSTIPGYEEKFNKAYQAQDFAEHAIKAAQERKKLDAAAKAGRNLRAMRSGNYANLTNGVAIVVGAAYVLHVTGYDKKIQAEARKRYEQMKKSFQNNETVYNITNQ